MNKKYCPNCGKQQPQNAKFCSNCGYDFRELMQRRSVKKRSRNRQNKIALLILLLGVLSLVIVLITSQRGNHYKSHELATTSSAVNSSMSSTTEDDSEQSTTEAGNQTNILPANIGPRVSAAAITYYAVKNSDATWGDFFGLDTNKGITVRLSTDEELLSKLTDRGQGMAYEVFNYHGVTSNDNTSFIYTIDKNDNINIYYLSPRSNADTYEPTVTISRSEIISYLNNHHYANNVKALGEKVVIEK
ncbi:zinc ribbon domain-containing protein [Limosilactobacillus sp. STM2_1]|uniref:Zinc ribbon domain-containing protein n=1 Tax=Limosilactobacillus rudii TaxID=2759755 RepID=A0A7W3UK20_9LACO|nr:zinc ribbon domain-containing protein [Limosilactobacillus rudii]MBB1079123.1 zinc ribbon domain-containing protein [Limosilactobacillus rudii]MBB1097002.1 zinc ribbon domain-containing protein [Limosilactobacillus rudii]MCD7133970.1 zinc ribbon domain-containing protein [Limosilactobacillus rudii]